MLPFPLHMRLALRVRLVRSRSFSGWRFFHLPHISKKQNSNIKKFFSLLVALDACGSLGYIVPPPFGPWVTVSSFRSCVCLCFLSKPQKVEDSEIPMLSRTAVQTRWYTLRIRNAVSTSRIRPPGRKKPPKLIALSSCKWFAVKDWNLFFLWREILWYSRCALAQNFYSNINSSKKNIYWKNIYNELNKHIRWRGAFFAFLLATMLNHVLRVWVSGVLVAVTAVKLEMKTKWKELHF